jgi:hypothetical protein
MGEVVVLRKDGPGPWLASYCNSSAGFVAVKSDANNVHSCRSSSIPSGYAACDCRSLPGGPPTFQYDAARSIDTIEQVREVTRDAVPIVQKGECTPGTYRCRQPFTIGDLQFCNAVGVWQISSHYCGPYTCYDAPGDEGPHCQCRPEARSLDSAVSSTSDRAVEARQSEVVSDQMPCRPAGTVTCSLPNIAPLIICDANATWQVMDKCCGLYSCRTDESGTGHCLCTQSFSLDSASSPRSLDSLVQMRDNEPTAGPKDPEPCTYGYLTCGDCDINVYGCNHQQKWVLLNACVPGTNCVRGENHGAFCVGNFGNAGKAMSGSADRLTVGTEEGVEGSTTLLTVAKDAAASTAKNQDTVKKRLDRQG